MTIAIIAQMLSAGADGPSLCLIATASQLTYATSKSINFARASW